MKTWKADSGIRPCRPFARSLVLAVAGICAAPLIAGTIDFQISQASSAASGASAPVYTYTYSLSGFDFQFNGNVVNEVDIQFNPNDYGALSNGEAGPDFNVLLLQPNNPPGATGDYSAQATADNPSLAGTFSVDFTWTGPGSPLDPGIAPAQTFQINTYDNTPGAASYGDLISSTTGTTTPFAASAVPEPSTAFLTMAGVIVGGASLAVKRRRSDTAC
jgi:hypothetical protein